MSVAALILATVTAPVIAESALQENVRANLTPYANFPKEGFTFSDVSPILRNPELFQAIIDDWTERYKDMDIEAVVGLGTRGFLFGPQLALQLKVPFVMVRKEGKLPGPCHQVDYVKEYGTDTFEIQRDALKPGQRTLLVDDFLSTGGSLRAAAELVERAGGEVVEAACIADIPFYRTEELPFPVYTLIGFGD